MNRSEKEAEVAELREKFQGAPAAILAEYRGDVHFSVELRHRLLALRL